MVSVSETLILPSWEWSQVFFLTLGRGQVPINYFWGKWAIKYSFLERNAPWNSHFGGKLCLKIQNCHFGQKCRKMHILGRNGTSGKKADPKKCWIRQDQVMQFISVKSTQQKVVRALILFQGSTLTFQIKKSKDWNSPTHSCTWISSMGFSIFHNFEPRKAIALKHGM